jgi:2-dehydropantoate 2-reductase
MDPKEVGRVELAIVFVKSTKTAEAADTARVVLTSEGLVLTLQNGLGNAEILAEWIASDRVLAGTTAHGATLLGPGRIRHAGQGPTLIGFWSEGQPARVRRVAETLNAASIETQVVEDARRIVWDKLLVNVGINAITALTGTRNGELLDLEITMDLARAAVEEAVAVARTSGVEVREHAVDHVFEVARATAVNRSSMGQDVDHRRATEIGVINGAIVERGQKLGVETPVNGVLYALVRTLEMHY